MLNFDKFHAFKIVCLCFCPKSRGTNSYHKFVARSALYKNRISYQIRTIYIPMARMYRVKNLFKRISGCRTTLCTLLLSFIIVAGKLNVASPSNVWY